MDNRFEEELENNLMKERLEKIQYTRVKYLRLLHRLGVSLHDYVPAKVLDHLFQASGKSSSLETATRTAMGLEESEPKGDLDFSVNILVLGKSGVGKSSTINSIFGEERAKTSVFRPGTTAVEEIVGTVDGVRIQVFDTPGLKTSVMEQSFNEKMLSNVKRFIKKCPPDIVLYVDRLDTQTRNLNDLPLLTSVTKVLGSSLWKNAVVALTHAASAPEEYGEFVAQQSENVQEVIGLAVGDQPMKHQSLMYPVSLVENRNGKGQKLLPDGLIWRPQLLLICFSVKILSELSSSSKPPDSKLSGYGVSYRSRVLNYLLSLLFQQRVHPKIPVESADYDIELENLESSEQKEEGDEFGRLLPFKALSISQIAKLSKEQRKAYFEYYDYRAKLLEKKQRKEELEIASEMKKRGKGHNGAVALPSELSVSPTLDSKWDHGCGHDGFILEKNLAIVGRFPAGIAIQIRKDKEEFNMNSVYTVAAEHGENGSSLASLDIISIDERLAYFLTGETKLKMLKKNKMTGGILISFLGEDVATGLKFEDEIPIGKCSTLVGKISITRYQGEVAYGANLEARIKDKDCLAGRNESSLWLSLVNCREKLALAANLLIQFSIGRSSRMAVNVGLDNNLNGKITVNTSSSEQLQLAILGGILPMAIAIYRRNWLKAEFDDWKTMVMVENWKWHFSGINIRRRLMPIAIQNHFTSIHIQSDTQVVLQAIHKATVKSGSSVTIDELQDSSTINFSGSNGAGSLARLLNEIISAWSKNVQNYF